jgi:two-component system heavy metal sensor histidine kinase CusS
VKKLTSITTRITAIFALLSTVVMISLGAIASYVVSEHFSEEDLTEINGKLELIQHALIKIDSLSQLQKMDDALIGHPALSVMVYAKDDRALYRTFNSRFPASILHNNPTVYGQGQVKFSKWEVDSKVFRGLTVRMQTSMPETPFLNVAIAVDIAHHEQFITRFQHVLWCYLFAGILLLAFIGWIAVRRGLTPIRNFVHVASLISAQHFNERIDLTSLPSELIDLGVSFNEMLLRLQDAFVRLSEFSSDIAHELRTPVSNLMTQGHVALSQARSAEEYREVLYSNIEEYERLSRMISDMLFLAKADNGLIVPHRESMDLGDELDAVIDFYEAVASDNRICVTRSGTASFQGDRLMMRRAFSNLLSNALRYTPKDMTITISVKQSGNAILISFDNPGKPIPPDALSRIFDRFYRIDSSRQRETEGTGLGLAITKSIVGAHGGQIRADSLENLVCFEITLPLK